MKTTITASEINKLAIPALIAGIAEPVLSITDTAVVGNVLYQPKEALSAVGIAGAFISMLIWVFGQTRSAISSIVSQYLGAGKLEEVKTLPAQAIAIITAISLLLILITYPFADYIFKLYNASGTILEYSSTYYKIRVFGLPFTLFTFAIFGTFRGLQNTFYPMIIAIIGASTNILLDLILVYGIKGCIPAMHIEGAAYASVAAQILMAILALYFLYKKTPISLKIQWPLHKELSRLTLMIVNLFVRTLALNVALYFGTSFSTAYGDKYIAAYTIAMNLWFFGAFFVDGYSSAGNILSGKLVGAKNYTELVGLSEKLTKYAIFSGIFLAAIGAILYFPLGVFFIKDKVVQQEFYKIFWIVLAMQPLCAITFVFDGIFKGLGKMATLRNVLLFATFLVFVPVIYLLDHYDYKLYAVWIAITAWIVARGIPLIITFRKEFVPKARAENNL